MSETETTGPETISPEEKSQAPSTVQTIIRRIETSRNKPLMIEEYRKIVDCINSDYKQWISEHSEDILTVSSCMDGIQSNLKSLSQDYLKLDSLIEQLRKAEDTVSNTAGLGIGHLEGGKKSRFNRFNKLMKVNLQELMNEIPNGLGRDSALGSILGSDTPTPGKGSEKTTFAEELKKSISSKLSERQSGGADSLNDVSTAFTISENLEKLEISILEQNAEMGLSSLAVLEEIEKKNPKNFGSFQVYGKYQELKQALFASLEEGIEFEDKAKSLTIVSKLIDVGMRMEAEDIFYKIHNNQMDLFRHRAFEEAKQGEEFIDSEIRIINIFTKFFYKVYEIVESIKTTYFFKTSERTNSARFGNWLTGQVNICLNELISHMADEMVSSQSKIEKLYRRLTIEFANADTKGVSCGFVLDEFFENYLELLKQNELDDDSFTAEGPTDTTKTNP